MSRFSASIADAELPDWLIARLKASLPGRTAQARFEPEMSMGRHFHPPRGNTRKAAVLALLCPSETGWTLPLMVRPANLTTHAGQIALPGGAIEGHESSAEAALRELREELGIPESQVRLLGRLSPLYVYVSNFFVEPWLGCLIGPPHFQPNSLEVAEILNVPLADLVNPVQHCRQIIHARGVAFSAPCLNWQGRVIWGATAMMLGELLALLEEPGGTGTC